MPPGRNKTTIVPRKLHRLEDVMDVLASLMRLNVTSDLPERMVQAVAMDMVKDGTTTTTTDETLDAHNRVTTNDSGRIYRTRSIEQLVGLIRQFGFFRHDYYNSNNNDDDDDDETIIRMQQSRRETPPSYDTPRDEKDRRMRNNERALIAIAQTYRRLASSSSSSPKDNDDIIVNSTPASLDRLLKHVSSFTIIRTTTTTIPDDFVAGASSILLRDDRRLLKKCTTSRLVGILRSFVRLRRDVSLELLLSVGRHHRLSRPGDDDDDDDTTEVSSSPDDAAHLLKYYTLLLSRRSSDDDDDDHGRETLFEMFRDYGNALLSASLSSSAASSAMYAMAKASYFMEMGVFDHLARVLASKATKRCEKEEEEEEGRGWWNEKTSHLALGLWSCGKMMSWEADAINPHDYTSHDVDNDDDGSIIRPSSRRQRRRQPPYHEHALIIARALADRHIELTSRDVAQSLWALGRLLRHDDDDDDGPPSRDHHLHPLVDRAARRLLHKFNAVEISNIVFALGRLSSCYRNDDVVERLVSRLTSDEWLLNRTSSQEAANVMLALGRLRRCRRETTTTTEEDLLFIARVFDTLSDVMMTRVEEATAQGIANALWAHREVGLRPPKRLFDLWAETKLGMVVGEVSTWSSIDFGGGEYGDGGGFDY